MGKNTKSDSFGVSSPRNEFDTEPRALKSGRIKISRSETIDLDEWQQEVLDYEGNIAIRAGRQVGKSTIISIKASKVALLNHNFSVMIISATERQAYLLFSKVLNYLWDNYRYAIKEGKDRPTKTEIKLKNGSFIRCLPTGLDGLGIRGYTINLLIADEAAFIPIEVWPAVTPMLSTTGGNIILISTPYGRTGYFYDCFNDDTFRTWHVSSEEVAKSRQDPQRTNMLKFYENEKERMTELQYAQEYLGEFVDELRQLFPDSLIKEICILRKEDVLPYNQNGEFYLGVDIARMGGDASTFQVLEKVNKDRYNHILQIAETKKLTTWTYDKILELDNIFHFKKIGIDAGSGSLGVTILDFLLRSPVKRKVEALNNRQINLDYTGERKRNLLKEDMYLNLLALMEKHKIYLLRNDDLIHSLRAIQYEFAISNNMPSRLRVFAKTHRYTDLVEGLIRSAWLINQKNLSSFFYSI